jgi:hypothetical protein
VIKDGTMVVHCLVPEMGKKAMNLMPISAILPTLARPQFTQNDAIPF